MYRSFTLTAFVILFSTAVFSQTPQPCKLKLSQAPTLRGLRLGMPVAAVSEILGAPVNPQPVRTQVSFIRSGNDYVRKDGLPPADRALSTEWYRNRKTLQAGNSSVEISTYGLKDVIRRNAGSIRLGFFQDKLESIVVFYNFSDMPWNGRDEFQRLLSAKSNFPANGWKDIPQTQMSEMRCRDFVMSVDGSDQGFAFMVSLIDLDAVNQIAQSIKQKWLETLAAEKERKKAFVP